LLEVDELSLDDYMLYLRDAFIYNYQQSEQGREYLEKCWTLEQTDMDTSTLKEMFGKEE